MEEGKKFLPNWRGCGPLYLVAFFLSLSIYFLTLNIGRAMGHVQHNRITKAPVFWSGDIKNNMGYYREQESWDMNAS